ncbi:MAG: ZIP family metal transporter [Pirellulales bacterium]
MWSVVVLGVYCLLIVVASCLGGWLPSRMRLTHTRMQLTMSFVAGLMLGVALLHLLPHAAAELGSFDKACIAGLGGLLAMFFLIRVFHIHHHDAGEAEADDAAGATDDAAAHSGCSHDHHHDHAHGHAHRHDPVADQLGSRYGWVGLFLGLAIHTLIDGIALGASVAAEAAHDPPAGLAGFSTFLAVVLHKPLDALSISSLMIASGWSLSRRRLVNLAFATLCPLGAAAFWLGATGMVESSQTVLGLALAFSAGVFLCISLGDLLPEVHFHSHDRLKLSLCLVAGVLLAYGVGFLEPAGTHAHGPHKHDVQGHHHDDHAEHHHGSH